MTSASLAAAAVLMVALASVLLFMGAWQGAPVVVVAAILFASALAAATGSIRAERARADESASRGSRTARVLGAGAFGAGLVACVLTPLLFAVAPDGRAIAVLGIATLAATPLAPAIAVVARALARRAGDLVGRRTASIALWTGLLALGLLLATLALVAAALSRVS